MKTAPQDGLFVRAATMAMVSQGGRAGRSESLPSRIETGRVVPSLNMLPRLSQALQVNVVLLLDDLEDRV